MNDRQSNTSQTHQNQFAIPNVQNQQNVISNNNQSQYPPYSSYSQSGPWIPSYHPQINNNNQFYDEDMKIMLQSLLQNVTEIKASQSNLATQMDKRFISCESEINELRITDVHNQVSTETYDNINENDEGMVQFISTKIKDLLIGRSNILLDVIEACHSNDSCSAEQLNSINFFSSCWQQKAQKIEKGKFAEEYYLNHNRYKSEFENIIRDLWQAT
jgi:hypothetical protein